MKTAIKFEHISKEYQIGSVGTGSLSHDINRFIARIKGKEDPNKKIKQFIKSENNDNAVLALDDINFEINQGEIVGFIGKNGAGKSTLLKLLSKVTTPSAGNIYVNGKVASLLEVGTGFHPELTGRENVYLNGAILGMKRSEISRKFDEIVDFSGVEQYIDTPVKRYSSGMYVRLAFAIAAHLDTDILVVDEVLAVGDYEFQRKSIGKMKDVPNSGRTVLFVSHQLDLILQLCNRGILLDKGVITMDGDVKSVIDTYYNLKDNALIPIGERTDRNGTGEVKIIDCSINGRNINNAHVVIGDEVRVELTVEVNALFDDVNFSAGLADKKGNSMCDFSSRIISRNIEFKEKGIYKAELLIPRWQVNVGIYDMSFMVFNKHSYLLDWIKSAITFEVQFGDFYQSNRLPDSGRMFLMDYNWFCTKV